LPCQRVQRLSDGWRRLLFLGPNVGCCQSSAQYNRMLRHTHSRVGLLSMKVLPIEELKACERASSRSDQVGGRTDVISCCGRNAVLVHRLYGSSRVRRIYRSHGQSREAKKSWATFAASSSHSIALSATMDSVQSPTGESAVNGSAGVKRASPLHPACRYTTPR
jgi:hypothetical protein